MAIARLADGTVALPRPETGAPTDAALEQASAILVRLAGLSVIVPEVLELGGHPSLLIERFDRIETAGVVYRVHQENSAQAPILVSPEFLKLTLFNACVGNAGNHAKNHSLLYSRGSTAHLAPAYDLLDQPRPEPSFQKRAFTSAGPPDLRPG